MVILFFLKDFWAQAIAKSKTTPIFLSLNFQALFLHQNFFICFTWVGVHSIFDLRHTSADSGPRGDIPDYMNTR